MKEAIKSKFTLITSKAAGGTVGLASKFKDIRNLRKGAKNFGKELKNLEKEVLPASTENSLVSRKMRHRIMAALSYLCLLVIIPMIFGRKFEFTRFHVKQGIVLLGLWVFGSFLFWLPYAGWLVVFAWLILIIIGLVNVFTSKERRLPLIGKLAGSEI